MSASVLRLIPAERTAKRAQKLDLSKCNFFCVLGNYEMRWLYAVGFKGGFAKIGLSGNPRNRLKHHYSASNGDVEWMHLFSALPRVKAHDAERRACRMAAAVSSRQSQSEWFKGLTREQAIACVRSAINGKQ